jgi:hypothetical protein
VGQGSAVTVNIELASAKSNLNEMVQNIGTFVAHNNYGLFIVGLILISLSTMLVGVACYHRRKGYRNKFGSGLVKLNNDDTIGFHRYRDLNDDNSDQDDMIPVSRRDATKANGTKSSVSLSNSNVRYSKLEDTDSKKLLFNDDDDEDEKVFVR